MTCESRLIAPCPFCSPSVPRCTQTSLRRRKYPHPLPYSLSIWKHVPLLINSQTKMYRVYKNRHFYIDRFFKIPSGSASLARQGKPHRKRLFLNQKSLSPVNGRLLIQPHHALYTTWLITNLVESTVRAASSSHKGNAGHLGCVDSRQCVSHYMCLSDDSSHSAAQRGWHWLMTLRISDMTVTLMDCDSVLPDDIQT